MGLGAPRDTLSLWIRCRPQSGPSHSGWSGSTVKRGSPPTPPMRPRSERWPRDADGSQSKSGWTTYAAGTPTVSGKPTKQARS